MTNIKALFVIDIQEDYMKMYDNSLLPAINTRIKEFASHNDLILYVQNVRRRKGEKYIPPFANKLEICSTHILTKERASIFDDASLLPLLESNSISEIEVVGIDGCCCVARSSLDASALGYKVTMPLSLIGIKNKERFEKKRTSLTKQGIILAP